MADEKDGTKVIDVTEMLTVVGEFGRFQKIVNFMFCLMTVPPIYQIMIMYFAGDQPSWKCAANSSTCLYNMTFDSKDNRRCKMARSDWEYTLPREYSIVTHFDISCEKEWMNQLVTSTFFLGWLLGALVGGWCADNVGRKLTLMVSFTILIITAFVSIFMPNIYMFIVCRFIIGFFLPGAFSQMFIIITEIVDSKHRPFAGIMMFFFGLSALAILGLKAYFIRNWKTLHIACSVPYAFMIMFFKFIPESVRYLRVKGEMEELMRSFQRIAYWNKREIPSNISIAPPSPDTINHKSNPWHLFRTSKLAINTSAQTFAYFTNGLVYYGLYLAAGEIGGSMYRDYIIISVTEIPICFVGIYFCERIGRKLTSTIPMALAAATCVALIFIPKKGYLSIVRIIVGMIGKCSVGSNSNTMTTWSMELYTTTVRGEAMGFFQAFMRLGAATAPWINKEFVKIDKSASYIFMASIAFITFCLLGLLPETKGVDTQDTEGEEEKKRDSINGYELGEKMGTNNAPSKYGSYENGGMDINERSSNVDTYDASNNCA